MTDTWWAGNKVSWVGDRDDARCREGSGRPNDEMFNMMGSVCEKLRERRFMRWVDLSVSMGRGSSDYPHGDMGVPNRPHEDVRTSDFLRGDLEASHDSVSCTFLCH